jgi:lipoprotein-releasing system ATP-binding protein
MAEPVATAPVLEIRSVIREFGEKRKTRVLHGIDLIIRHGEFAALIGPSGSGKSTMLNIMGLLDRPTSGEVLLSGQPMTHLDDDALTRSRSRTLGFVFQFHHLLPAFTALENVMIPAWGDRGTADAGLRASAQKLLHEVGLRERINNRASDLSGGEAQRVAIARALCQNPPLILADEPTGNLDTQTADGIFALLRRVNRERSTTFLIVTHDERLAGRCDRIIRLVDGRIVQDLRRGDESGAGSGAPSLFLPLPAP